nr:DUF2239 family protein [uncultured Sphingosinicella sp.]
MGTVTAFMEGRVIGAGDVGAVTRLLEEGYGARDHSAIQAFDDESGRAVDLDFWDAGKSAPEVARGRGRPKLGVTSREVTLLPRQWEWLAAQPGGASAIIRRLVDEAQRSGAGAERERRDAAYRFMQATCGDRLGYEEALRALYRGEGERFDTLTADWPEDIRAYIARLLGNGPAAAR